MTKNVTAKNPPDWAQTLVNPASFQEEQAKLGHVWTLLGLTTDIPRDGDWIRATLGGRSVFVQRFGDSLRGFENVCAHRFYPLRNEDKGNGLIRCGFHHWQYNNDGLAVGIPKCQEMFGVTPRELNARLSPIEISTCGILIFGRFSSMRHTETLEQSFGEAFPILQAMWNLKKAPYHIKTDIAANWKLLYHITLDDYHIVAVHPSTFGKNGYLATDTVHYYRLGKHSAYFVHGSEDDVRKMADELHNGEYRATDYRIFQFFPNFLALQIKAGMSWYVLIQQYVPITHNRSLSRAWYCQAPYPTHDRTWVHTLARQLSAPFVPFVLPFYIRKIFGEDNSVCERIQTVANQIDGFPILGRHEERIAWFEETYAEVMADTNSPRRTEH